MRRILFFLILIMLTLLLAGCANAEPNNRQATVQALSTRLADTVTPQGDAVTTDTAIQDAQATATQVSGNLIATQTTHANLDASGVEATASAFSPFEADLARYGVDPQKGRPGFIHPPVTLKLEEFHSVSESGLIQCQFDRTWLWLIEE